MIQVCSNFDGVRVFITDTRPDEIADGVRAQALDRGGGSLFVHSSQTKVDHARTEFEKGRNPLQVRLGEAALQTDRI